MTASSRITGYGSKDQPKDIDDNYSFSLDEWKKWVQVGIDELSSINEHDELPGDDDELPGESITSQTFSPSSTSVCESTYLEKCPTRIKFHYVLTASQVGQKSYFEHCIIKLKISH